MLTVSDTSHCSSNATKHAGIIYYGCCFFIVIVVVFRVSHTLVSNLQGQNTLASSLGLQWHKRSSSRISPEP